MRRTLVSASATTPPLELTLTANAAALAMQNWAHGLFLLGAAN